MTRIGVLTGGGDVPGLNPCIETLVYGAVDRGYEVVGIRRGWAGVLHYDLDSTEPQDHNAQPLSKNDVRTIDRTGGTFLHTSRTNPGRVKPRDVPEFLEGQGKGDPEGPFDFTDHVLRVVERLGIDWLVPIGGDDTLSYAERLSREGIPVIELFGRNCGETSLLSAYLAGVDRAIISEVPFDPELLANYLLEDKASNPSQYAMVTVSEGARMIGGEVLERGEADAYGHRKLGGIGLATGDVLKRVTGEDIIYQQVGYLMRSGAPDALDLMVAVNYANMALNLIDQGQSANMVVLRRGTYTSVPVETILQGVKRVDVEALYDDKRYRPLVRQVDGKPMFLY